MIQAYIPYEVIEKGGGFDNDGNPTPPSMIAAIIHALTSGQIDQEDISTVCILCGRQAELTGVCAHAKDSPTTILGTKALDGSILIVSYSVCLECAPRYKEIEIKLRNVANN